MVQRGILLILMKTFGHLSSLKPDLVCLSVGLKPEWVSNFHALFSSVDTELFPNWFELCYISVKIS